MILEVPSSADFNFGLYVHVKVIVNFINTAILFLSHRLSASKISFSP